MIPRKYALIGHTHDIDDLLGLGDPNADRILFWDDSFDGINYLTVGTGLTLSGTTLSVNAGGIDHGALGGLTDDDHTQYVLRSILTTNGDLFTRTAGAIARLGVGSDGDVLTVVAGAPVWGTGASSGYPPALGHAGI